MVEADVRNNGKLRPGSFAHAEIVTNDAKMAVTVPNNAIVTFAGIEKVLGGAERQGARETDHYRPAQWRVHGNCGRSKCRRESDPGTWKFTDRAGCAGS